MEQLFRKFAPLCAMVMKPNGDSVDFLGTAFAVHEAGYLATAAHVVKDQERIMISPSTDATGYQTTSQKLRCLEASVVEMDERNDVALLKFNEPVNLKLPENLLGNPDKLTPGAAIMHLGYPFGKTGSLVLAMRSGYLVAKIETAQGIKQLYVEGVAYSGATGGPLVDARHDTIIGIVNSQLGLLPKPSNQNNDFKLPVLTELSFAAPGGILTNLLQRHYPG